MPERRGQRRHATDNRVEAERARHALELAAGGARVAVVSSGDPGIFAMAAAVLEVVDGDVALADVEVRIVPGLSAMQAAAARVGAPLGHDFCVVSLSDQLKPWEVVERRLDAAGAADLVARALQPRVAHAARAARRAPSRCCAAIARRTTPVVVARAVGAPEESVSVTTLGELDLDVVDMRTLLIVGSSTTRTIGGRAAARLHPAPLPRVSARPGQRRRDGGLGRDGGPRRAAHDDHRAAPARAPRRAWPPCARRRCPW